MSENEEETHVRKYNRKRHGRANHGGEVTDHDRKVNSGRRAANIKESDIRREKAAKESAYKYRPTQKEIDADKTVVTDKVKGDPVTKSDLRAKRTSYRLPVEHLKRTVEEQRELEEKDSDKALKGYQRRTQSKLEDD